MNFLKKNLTLTHYMLSAWWLYFLDGLGHYVIHLGKIEQVLVMINNTMTLGYTYDKLMINTPPNILCKLAHTGRIITWTP